MEEGTIPPSISTEMDSLEAGRDETVLEASLNLKQVRLNLKHKICGG